MDNLLVRENCRVGHLRASIILPEADDEASAVIVG